MDHMELQQWLTSQDICLKCRRPQFKSGESRTSDMKSSIALLSLPDACIMKSVLRLIMIIIIIKVIIRIIMNLFYIAQFNINGTLTAVYIVV